MLVPGTESAGPAAGDVHPADDGVLPADMTDQLDLSLDQDPPVVGMVAFAEQVDSWLEGDLVASRRSNCVELVVAQALEDRQRAQLVDAHQIVAR